MYAKLTNGQIDKFPYTVGQLRRDNPNTSFPKKVSDEMLASYGVIKVNHVPQPNYNEQTQRIEQNAQPHEEAGQWFLGWGVVDKTAEELTQQDVDKAEQIRAERNTLLSASDWTQVADAPVDQAAWATYRQALRDITTQTGFPWSVTWPTQP